ncbi:MAG: response regulator [Polyangiaceae bacterium]|nr:response regulator [Polyangiaceae bacterium]
MTPKKTILIIEDETLIVLGLRDALEFEGFHVVSAAKGREGIALARQENPDAIILDLMLPDLNGYQVCEELRRWNSFVPILMLTARSQEVDKIRGLNAGADDYMTKPFSVGELIARLRAIFRRAARVSDAAHERFQVGAAEVDLTAHALQREGVRHELSFYEVELLRLLREKVGQPVARDEILSRVWGLEATSTNRTVDNCIVKLRRKIEAQPDRPAHILTVYGFGYKLILLAFAGRIRPVLIPGKGGSTGSRGGWHLVAVRGPARWVLLLALGVLPAQAQGESWARNQARQLSSQAAAQAASQPEAAARLYLDAIQIDGSYGAAYLGLGALREQSGDAREAEQVYSEAIEHLPGFWEARQARAKLRRRLQRRAEARADLGEALALRRSDGALLEQLAAWCAEDGDFPRALALYRQLRWQLEQQGDGAGVGRVKLRVKALGLLVAELDPLRARHPRRDATRQALEGLVRAQGW